jgi:type IX secretion system PorP/SprF family membrane protein
MIFKKSILALIFFGGMLSKSFAQTDPHFSQYYTFSSNTNPALSAAEDNAVRVSGIYRNQWRSITQPYSTSGISADFATGKNVQIGVSLLRQQAGDAGFVYTNGALSFAYTGVKWGQEKNQQLVFALQGGFINRRFDPSKLQMDDQWIPGIGYNPGLPTNDIFPVRALTVEDFSAGVLYKGTLQSGLIKPYVGFAAHHINRPQDPFLSDADLPFMPIRTSLQAGASISLSPGLRWIPHTMYMQQGTARAWITGMSFEMAATEYNSFIIGAQLRAGDSYIAYAGLGFGEWTMGCSYDVGYSRLSQISGRANSIELSLCYRKRKISSHSLDCPRF